MNKYSSQANFKNNINGNFTQYTTLQRKLKTENRLFTQFTNNNNLSKVQQKNTSKKLIDLKKIDPGKKKNHTIILKQSHETHVKNIEKRPNIKKLISNSIKQFSQEKHKKLKEQQLLTRSRKKIIESKRQMDKTIRQQNKKKVVNHSNLQNRLPWGTDQSRIRKYVVSTIQKMNKINKERSSSKSGSKRKRDRKQLGLQFLDGMPESKIQKLILRNKLKSHSISRSSSRKILDESKCNKTERQKQSSSKLGLLHEDRRPNIIKTFLNQKRQ